MRQGALAGCAALLLACTGDIGGGGDYAGPGAGLGVAGRPVGAAGAGPGVPGAAGGSGDRPGGAADDASGGTPGSDPGPDPGTTADEPATLDECVGMPFASVPSFTVRLTESDYNRSLRDLFAPYGAQPEPRVLPQENEVHGFVLGRTQDPSGAFIEQYELGAWDAAGLAAAQLRALAPCDGQAPSACGRDFITRFGKRAFRRPLHDDELGRYAGFFDSALAGWDYDTAVRMTVAALLQSPEFLYLIELGEPVDPAQGELRRLDAYELASRLSYTLIGSMPDDALLAAADADALETPDQVRSHAQRLLASADARDVVATFHERWLGIDRIWDLQKSPELFPDFGVQTEASLRASAERFVQWAFWEQGSLSALLTGSEVFVDAELAGLYGVDPPAGDGLQLLDLGPRRAGYFTQAGWLAANGNPTEDSPVHRGIFVREHVLCADTPAPPDTGIPPLPMKGPDLTTRENLEQRHEQGTCGGCHRLFDGIGFAFGHYDAIGAFRELDNGKPVDATGGFVEVPGLSSIEFDGAPDMMAQLQDTPVVARCLTTQWLRFALRRDTTEADACTIVELADGLQSDGDMQGLLMRLVTSQAFFHKALDEE